MSKEERLQRKNSLMGIDEKMLDELISGYKKQPEDLIGENGLLKELTKRLLERAMSVELSEHLGHDKNACVEREWECPQRPLQEDG